MIGDIIMANNNWNFEKYVLNHLSEIKDRAELLTTIFNRTSEKMIKLQKTVLNQYDEITELKNELALYKPIKKKRTKRKGRPNKKYKMTRMQEESFNDISMRGDIPDIIDD
jgi:vesicle coat complex subunit